jgi:hypothetical protein
MTVTTWAIVSIAVAIGRVLAIVLICRVACNPAFPKLARVASVAAGVAAFLPVAITHP